MKKLILGVAGACVTMTLVGCGTNLRRPLCSDGEMAFPPGSEGRYRLSMPAQETAQTGAWTGQEQTEFIIHEAADGFELAAPKSTVTRVPQIGRFFKRTKGANFASGGDDVGVMIANVCRIGGVYYAQTEQDNGSFVMARFDLSASGITISDLMFPPARLKAAGIPYFFLPIFSEFDKTGKWQFDVSDPARLVVDNRGVEDRERFMALSEPTSLGWVFSRVSSSSALPKGWVVTRLRK